jgi:hypothetical protein
MVERLDDDHPRNNTKAMWNKVTGCIVAGPDHNIHKPCGLLERIPDVTQGVIQDGTGAKAEAVVIESSQARWNTCLHMTINVILDYLIKAASAVDPIPSMVNQMSSGDHQTAVCHVNARDDIPVCTVASPDVN